MVSDSSVVDKIFVVDSVVTDSSVEVRTDVVDSELISVVVICPVVKTGSEVETAADVGTCCSVVGESVVILAVDISPNVVNDSSDVEGSVVEAEEVICVVSSLSVVDSIGNDSSVEVRADVVDSLVNDSVV